MTGTPSKSTSENGSFPPGERILTSGSLQFLPARQEAFVGDHRVLLNYIECQILQLLIEQQPHVVTRTEMMMASWGCAPADRAILMDEMVADLQRKLGEGVTIKTFPGIGYSLQ